jgi:hypothetical protein
MCGQRQWHIPAFRTQCYQFPGLATGCRSLQFRRISTETQKTGSGRLPVAVSSHETTLVQRDRVIPTPSRDGIRDNDSSAHLLRITGHLAGAWQQLQGGRILAHLPFFLPGRNFLFAMAPLVVLQQRA